MNILVVGGGGREHAIIKKLRENSTVEKIYALPGNGGMIEAECVNIAAKDLQGICEFALSHSVDYAVVAPDDPLVLGLVDELEQRGIPCFGPRKNAAVIEGSKVFSKGLMKKYGIPTAAYEVFEDADAALRYAAAQPLPLVIKADGLALGKGVVIAQTREEAAEAIREMMLEDRFGQSGRRIVVEEYLDGPEVTVLSFTDGNVIVPMISSMDHKRAGDNDTGLNTGGMGTVAPNPFYTDEIAAVCMRDIFLPPVRAMKAEGREFRGCLYFGLMLTERGPKVIEYNCRFGDPETQVVLPLLQSDLLTVMQAVTNGTLAETEVRFSNQSACCVILASEGYPVSYQTGYELTLPSCSEGQTVFVAGARREGDKLLSSGGRVLGCTAVADTLENAVNSAYELVKAAGLENGFFRHDIGQRALRAKGGC
ncbi:MAG: phosphoribosylamine--glycine ligase [Clostridiales bacterium]|nr:phosphoribosylamine--glycine ligase [Candidatus Apopatocola equi]